MFNPEHLRTLRAVVEEGTVLAAADELGLTPSAVSQQIAKLTETAGQPVLVRRGRNVVPTDAATVLVRIGIEMQRLDERARSELERLTHEVAGSLAVSGFATSMRSVIALAVGQMRRDHPHLELSLAELDPDVSMERLLRRQVDLAVVHDWTDQQLVFPEGIHVHLLGEDVVDLVAPADHDLPVRADGTVYLRDLHDRTWIDENPGVYNDWLVAALREAKVNYRIASTVDTYASKIALAAAGFGLCLVPRLGRDPFTDEVVFLPVRPRPVRRIFAAYRDSSQDRPAVRAMLAALDRAWHEVPT